MTKFSDVFGGETPTPSGLTPTSEQQRALDLFGESSSFAIEAGAGTGKTATLLMLAQSTNRRGQYVAFNKAIVTEAGEKFPSRVRCNTAHSLAFRSVGKQYAHRLNSNRMRSRELATRLGLTSIQFNVGGSPKTLQPGYLASHVMRAAERFCQTADPEPSARHFPYIDGIDLPTEDGRRTYERNNQVAEELLPALQRAWKDLTSPQGQLPFRHSHYLKMWQLSDPTIEADFILFDEVQDADPVMADVVLRQASRGTQVVLVGDSQQEIYSWRGAVNAFQMFGLDHTTFLTQSFRFGPEIAGVANMILERLDAPLRLVGDDTQPGTVAPTEELEAVLTRTNSTAVRTVLELQRDSRPVALVGGGREVVAFARAARDLQVNQWTAHPELACFDAWDEVKEYVVNDPQGSDLLLMVQLVEEFGVDLIEQALNGVTREGPGVVTVTTAHKAKGREWGSVMLSSDFGPRTNKRTGESIDPTDEEQRLLYVAVTRARRNLDITLVPQLAEERV